MDDSFVKATQNRQVLYFGGKNSYDWAMSRNLSQKDFKIESFKDVNYLITMESDSVEAVYLYQLQAWNRFGRSYKEFWNKKSMEWWEENFV